MRRILIIILVFAFPKWPLTRFSLSPSNFQPYQYTCLYTSLSCLLARFSSDRFFGAGVFILSVPNTLLIFQEGTVAFLMDFTYSFTLAYVSLYKLYNFTLHYAINFQCIIGFWVILRLLCFTFTRPACWVIRIMIPFMSPTVTSFSFKYRLRVKISAVPRDALGEMDRVQTIKIVD